VHIWYALAAHNSLKQRTTMKTYICIVCGFIYDETAGRPEDGIAPGTKWADVPETWECPDCGVAKADFEAVEI
jgi:rubredoxin